MAEFTLLKLQFEDATFTAHAPFSGAGGDSDAESDSDDANGDEGGGDEEDGDSDRSLVPLVVGLVFLVVVAVAVKKFRESGEA